MNLSPLRKTAVRRAAFWLAAAAAAMPGAVSAATGGFEVAFAVSGVRSDSGTLRAVLCTGAEHYPDGCRLAISAPARVVGSRVVFKDVPAGTYAFALYHDEDNNGKLTMARPGLPAEGLAFSNDAIAPTGVPSFKAAALEVKGDAQQTVKMRYFRR